MMDGRAHLVPASILLTTAGHSWLDNGWMTRMASFTHLEVENLVGVGHASTGTILLHH